MHGQTVASRQNAQLSFDEQQLTRHVCQSGGSLGWDGCIECDWIKRSMGMAAADAVVFCICGRLICVSWI